MATSPAKPGGSLVFARLGENLHDRATVNMLLKSEHLSRVSLRDVSDSFRLCHLLQLPWEQ